MSERGIRHEEICDSSADRRGSCVLVFIPGREGNVSLLSVTEGKEYADDKHEEKQICTERG